MLTGNSYRSPAAYDSADSFNFLSYLCQLSINHSSGLRFWHKLFFLGRSLACRHRRRQLVRIIMILWPCRGSRPTDNHPTTPLRRQREPEVRITKATSVQYHTESRTSSTFIASLHLSRGRLMIFGNAIVPPRPPPPPRKNSQVTRHCHTNIETHRASTTPPAQGKARTFPFRKVPTPSTTTTIRSLSIPGDYY